MLDRRTTAAVRLALGASDAPSGEGAAGAPALENIASKFSPPLTCEDASRDRVYDLRRALWGISEIARCRRCGRVPIGSAVAVQHSPELGAGFGGLETCGSVWVCPVCARKIAARRQVEIGTALGTWQDQGGAFALVTLTMRHGHRHRLLQEIDALTAAWHSVNRSRVWGKHRDRLGSPGYIRVLEITHGQNGWHAHLHFVLLVAGGTSAADVARLADWLFPKWHRAVLAAGMPGALAVGQDARLVDGATATDNIAGYLTKAGSEDPARDLGRELMGAMSKTARSDHGTQPVWRLPEQFLETGEADLIDRWLEYEAATFRRRQLVWSAGVRDLLRLGQELTDDEIAEESAGDEIVVWITRAGWRTALSLGEPTSRILAALEHGGPEGLREHLDSRGIAYVTHLSDLTARDVPPALADRETS